MSTQTVAPRDKITGVPATPRCDVHPIGRPRCLDETERRDAILDAASCVLQETGYHAASMDRIAKSAGMSKKTLYQSFPSKRALFESLVTDRLLMIDTPVCNTGGSLREQLVESLNALTHELMRPERLCLLRSVVAESRASEIRQLIGDLFDMKCKVFPLRRWLRDQHARGLIVCEDIEVVTDILFGMTLGLLTLGELTGCRANRTPAERASLIDQAVTVFLDGVDGGRPRAG